MVQFMMICKISCILDSLSINRYRISYHAFSSISEVYNQIFLYLNNNIMSEQNFSNSSNNIGYLNSVDNDVYYMIQIFCFVYTLLCIFWLVYVICDIISQVRNKRRLVTLIYLDSGHDYANRLFMQKEAILRNSIFLVFLCFELSYCLVFNIYAFLWLFIPLPTIPVSIDSNCELNSGTFLADVYDHRFGVLLLRLFSLLIKNISFSMLIWMFGASLLHLSYAARNELRVKVILRFILIGLTINLIIAVPLMIPSVSLFGIIAYSLKDQISFFFVLCIARWKFFPAMNSRIIDAFHLNNTKVYLEQRRLLKRYKTLIYFLFFSFELHILKDVFLYSLYMILESISVNSCWFHAAIFFPVFTISDSLSNILYGISFYVLISARVIGLIFNFNMVVVNLIFIYIFFLQCLKRMNFYNKKIYRYRYQGFSNPLLS